MPEAVAIEAPGFVAHITTPPPTLMRRVWTSPSPASRQYPSTAASGWRA